MGWQHQCQCDLQVVDFLWGGQIHNREWPNDAPTQQGGAPAPTTRTASGARPPPKGSSPSFLMFFLRGARTCPSISSLKVERGDSVLYRAGGGGKSSTRLIFFGPKFRTKFGSEFLPPYFKDKWSSHVLKRRHIFNHPKICDSGRIKNNNFFCQVSVIWFKLFRKIYLFCPHF